MCVCVGGGGGAGHVSREPEGGRGGGGGARFCYFRRVANCKGNSDFFLWGLAIFMSYTCKSFCNY